MQSHTENEDSIFLNSYADRKTKEEMGPGQGNIRKGKEGTR